MEVSSPEVVALFERETTQDASLRLTVVVGVGVVGGTERVGVPVFLGWIGGTGLEGIDGEGTGDSPSDCGVAIREGGVVVLGGGGGLPGGGLVLGLGGGIVRLGGPGFEGLSVSRCSGVERCGGVGTFLLGN